MGFGVFLMSFGIPVVSEVSFGEARLVDRRHQRVSRSQLNGALSSVARKYQFSAPSGVEPGEFLNTSETYTAFAEAGRDALTLLNAQPGLAAAFAASHLKKWMPENGAPFGWYVPADVDFRQRKQRPFDPRLLAWFRQRTLDGWPSYSDFLGSNSLRVPSDSSHGAPTFGTGIDDLLAHLAFAAEASALPSLSAVRKLVAEANSRAGLSFLGDEPVIITHSRTGPMGKPTPTREWVGPRLFETGETTGVYCRRRHVKGVPTWFNEMLRGVILWHQLGLKRWHGFGHGADEFMEAKFMKSYDSVARFGAVQILSDDASNFDDTVSLLHLEQLRDLYYVWPNGLLRDLYDSSFTMRVLSGPLHRDDPLSLYERDGGVASGLISTTLDDSVVNACILCECIAAASGRSIPQVLSALDEGSLDFWVQGDDSLIFTTWDLDVDAYLMRAEELGYVRKLERYPVFLMRWYPGPGKQSFTSAIRAAMRTATRESKALGPAFERFGTYVRWQACQKDPMLDVALSICGELPYTRDELTRPSRYALSPDLAAMMEEEARGPQGLERSLRMVREALARGVTSQQLALFRRLGLLDLYHEEAVYATDGRGFDWRRYFSLRGE